MRHIIKEKASNLEELQNLLKNPSSIEWGNYLSVSLANKIFVNRLTGDLSTDFLCHSFIVQESMINSFTRFLA